jgi:Reverse transcriptase (RNA-dependent DNA polymerase)
MDVSTAYLNAPIDKDIYLRPPPGYQVKGKVWKLKRAVYGLKQSGRLWFEHSREVFESLGFKCCGIDPCLYFQGLDDTLVVVVQYVDDYLFMGPNEEIVNQTCDNISKRYKMKRMQSVSTFLGVNINRNETSHTIILSQPQLIDKIIALCRLEDARALTFTTPLAGDPIPAFNVDEGNFDCPFQEVTGMLNYLAHWSRPDLSCAVSTLAKFNQNHNETHWKRLKRLVRYLKCTKDAVLCLGGKSQDPGDMRVEAFSDASFNNKGKSRSGFVILYNGSAISWRSKMQTQTADSTATSEVYAAVMCAKRTVSISGILGSIGLRQYGPIKFFVDNQSALANMTNPSSQDELMYIGNKTSFLRDHYRYKRLDYEYCSTVEMVADVMTKGLNKNLHVRCLEAMGFKFSSVSHDQSSGGLSQV